MNIMLIQNKKPVAPEVFYKFIIVVDHPSSVITWNTLEIDQAILSKFSVEKFGEKIVLAQR